MSQYIVRLDQTGMDDLERVGGKNASLGEMISHLSDLGVTVPGGFATTAHAFREFLAQTGLGERIDSLLADLDVDDVKALADAGQNIRQWIVETPLQPALHEAVGKAYAELEGQAGAGLSVAVRSSATAEDLRMPPLPASRKPISMSSAWMKFCKRFTMFLPVFTTTGPSPTGSTMALIMPVSHCRPASS